MHARHALGSAVATIAAISVAAAPAAASPPDVIGPFSVDQALLDDVTALVEETCGVDVVEADGTGEILFRHFFTDADGEPVRGQGWFHMTIDLTTSTGATTTIRERSMDRYTVQDGEFVWESTSGRATAFFGLIGHITADGHSGKAYDVCAPLL